MPEVSEKGSERTAADGSFETGRKDGHEGDECMSRARPRCQHGMSERNDWSGRDRVRGHELSQAWAIWLSCVAWQYFVTLTFDPKKVFPANAALASTEAFWWCGQVGRVLRSAVGWVYAVERGRGGAWHAHGLLVGVPGGLGKAPAAIWAQRNGRIHVRLVDDTNRGVLYTTKEAALSGEVVRSGRRTLIDSSRMRR
jgi:hypothetical protein